MKKNKYEITLYLSDNTVEVHQSEYSEILIAHKDFEQYLINPYIIDYKVEKIRESD